MYCSVVLSARILSGLSVARNPLRRPKQLRTVVVDKLCSSRAHGDKNIEALVGWLLNRSFGVYFRPLRSSPVLTNKCSLTRIP